MVFSRKSKMYNIEIHDKNINKDLCRLIIRIEKGIISLKNILEKGAPGDANSEIEDLLNSFYKAHTGLERVSVDLAKIENAEAQEKGYVQLNDGGFLRDKYAQIRRMKKILNELIDMLEDRPTEKEFETDLLNRMVQDVNVIIDSMNSIIQDDKKLETIYNKTS